MGCLVFVCWRRLSLAFHSLWGRATGMAYYPLSNSEFSRASLQMTCCEPGTLSLDKPWIPEALFCARYNPPRTLYLVEDWLFVEKCWRWDGMLSQH